MSSDSITKSVSGASEYTVTVTDVDVASNARSCGNHASRMSGATIPDAEAPPSDRTSGFRQVPRYSRSPSRVLSADTRTRYRSPGVVLKFRTIPGHPVPEIARPAGTCRTCGWLAEVRL